MDQAVARYELEFTRVEYAARAGIEVAKAVLLSEERPTGRTLRLASDPTVDISLKSEDGKLNFPWLLCEDEGTKDEWRERPVRLLDGLREGCALDLSFGEAELTVKGPPGLQEFAQMEGVTDGVVHGEEWEGDP